jgi:hypothetical protein
MCTPAVPFKPEETSVNGQHRQKSQMLSHKSMENGKLDMPSCSPWATHAERFHLVVSHTPATAPVYPAFFSQEAKLHKGLASSSIYKLTLLFWTDRQDRHVLT